MPDVPGIGVAIGVVSKMDSGMKILRLKVTLLGIKPPIWRRLEAPADLSLHGLHACLQAAFGWTDSHLHEFGIDGQTFAPPDSMSGMAKIDSREQPLGELEGKVKAFGYRYDFGDEWHHRIEIEAWAKAVEGVQYPRCTAGARACPPEDCGGDQGYMELIEILKDRRHERYRDLKEWVGSRFDPEAFDLAKANAALARVKVPGPRAIPGPLTRAKTAPGESMWDKSDKIVMLAGMKKHLKSAETSIPPELEKALLGFVEMKIDRALAPKKGRTGKVKRATGGKARQG